MKKTFFAFIGLSFLLLTACSQPVETPEELNVEKTPMGLFETIETRLQQGIPLAEAPKPAIALPGDIHDAQIGEYYALGDITFATVRRRSMNVYIETLPMDFEDSFAGVLALSPGQTEWEKILTIKDKDPTNKNNPYWLWSKNGALFLTVVDQNGAGSGEGFMKLISSFNGKNWTQKECSYFSGMDDSKPDMNYFEASANLTKYELAASDNCDNLLLEETLPASKPTSKKACTPAGTSCNYAGGEDPLCTHCCGGEFYDACNCPEGAQCDCPPVGICGVKP